MLLFEREELKNLHFLRASKSLKPLAEIIPPNTTIVDLDIYPPPDLVIEIAKTSFSDDIASKRMLYEKLNFREYWVVNVVNAQLNCFCDRLWWE